ncbi:MAG: hypothetical protein CO093_01750, partial [Alphaproteobacteria bacterium CG_4_9_14_3_um_filter_47_13]
MTFTSTSSLFAKKEKIEDLKNFSSGDHCSMESLKKICQDHNIDENLLLSLGETLSFACFLYNIRIGNRIGKITNREVKRQLAKIERQAGKLKKDLQELHPQVSRECVVAYRELSEEAMTVGANARLTKIEANDKIRRFEEISVFPAIIELVCKVANAQLVPASAGRNADDALYVWVKEVSRFWTGVLNRSYTLDTHNGELITPAGKFLADCMVFVDPSARGGPRKSDMLLRWNSDIKTKGIYRYDKKKKSL